MQLQSKTSRIIASDFDGTLMRGQSVTEADAEAIKEWQDRGNLFGLVTGRDLYAAKKAAERAAEVSFDFIICCSGAYILDSEEKCVWSNTANTSRLTELTDFILQRNPLWLSRSLGMEMLGIPIGLNIRYRPGQTDESGRVYVTPEIFAQGSGFNIIHTAFENAETASEYTNQINKIFGDYITAYRNEQCVDIPGAGTGKSQSLFMLSKIYKIPCKSITPIGDNYNDIGMIRDFDGCAVSSGKEEVKSAASAVYDDISGLIYALLS